ncbi:glutaredoxin 3 [Methylovirgula sp. HY1]|uniref:glutaredoxin 3 n=1 Tax=Methylovirgula sp. HY1 TaxID=2822761 RepID=UPI001C5AB270|nr:glutaredoxin 3 [Methylovirgula sp. HY1]QXX75694.1 Glutaredoxin 3 [Methylovirgula sp. HY1]
MPTPVEITIYTTQTCPYCRRAKELLQKKNLAYQEISVDGDFEARAQMTNRANGASTVPQIFFGDTHVGGCDDLYELHYDGKLDLLLADLAR